MSDLYREKSDLYIARRLESKAHNELVYCEHQAEDQRIQLDNLLKYKDECVDGLKTARETGLTPLHIRELQLLVKHINSVVETILYKVQSSQENLEVAEEVWQKNSEHYKKVKEAMRIDKEVPKDDVEHEWKERVKSTEYFKDGADSIMAKSNKKSRQ